MYSVRIPYTEFQRYLCEEMMTAKFNQYVEDDGLIEIEYKYGDYKNGKSQIKWRIPETPEKIYSTRYTGSSHFAMWWCGVSDGVEDDE